MTGTNDTPSEIIACRLLRQAEWCEKLGSNLYSQLLRESAADVRGLGVCWAVLQDHHADPPGSALALRFLGAVHRLVLEGKSPQLAACYPSMGGDAGCDDLWPRFQKFVGEHEIELRRLVHLPVQTNEVSRCAALLGGFLTVSQRTGLPLRLLEMGASAGLLLRWDHYRYEEGNEGWGNPASPVRISGAFADAWPGFNSTVRVAERCGCDNFPIDPTTEEGKLTLQSYVWPDQVKRFHQLAAAIEVARQVPAQIDKANAADWIEMMLEVESKNVATVIYHSIVWQYLLPNERARIQRAIESAALSARTDRPLAWLRFEPAERHAEVRLQCWPGGDDQLLAQSGFHGMPVKWLDNKNC
ncbi:MAG TPA: DUF2332 domain-containing protein [Candidatus Angelobacter sp.]|nr:DUF2332 domain-containing protein [Candidatus Angelobacter sp.]